MSQVNYTSVKKSSIFNKIQILHLLNILPTPQLYLINSQFGKNGKKKIKVLLSSCLLSCHFLQLNFLVTENSQREILDPLCEGVQSESLDVLISVACQCVSSNPEDRPTMHRVVQVLESEVMTPCPSDFYDSNSDWEPAMARHLALLGNHIPISATLERSKKQTLKRKRGFGFD